MQPCSMLGQRGGVSFGTKKIVPNRNGLQAGKTETRCKMEPTQLAKLAPSYVRSLAFWDQLVQAAGAVRHSLPIRRGNVP